MRTLVTSLVALGLLCPGPASLAQTAGGGANPLGDLFSDPPKEVPPESLVLEHDQDCEHEPLHGGSLVPLGAHAAHVEITFDPLTATFVAYVLDAEALEPVRISQKFLMMRLTVDWLDEDRVALLAAKEDDETGEVEGDTSVFWGATRKLAGATTMACLLDQIAIAGKTYRHVEFVYPQ